MAFPALGVSGTRSRSAGRYRWVVVWLSIGCAMALLLLANAVRDYAFVSRILAIQQVRHQMTQIAAEVEQRLRRNDIKEGILQSALAGSPRGEESINLRNTDGVLLEHLGRDFPHTEFSREEEHNAFSRREALFRTLPTSSGDVVVEVFPMRPGRRPVAAPSGPATADSRLLLLEIAMPLKDADAAVLTPIRRNLIINLAAGLSLLTTVLLAGAGLRSYVQGRRLEEQMEIARQVQSRLLPKSTLKLPGHQLSTEYKPSEEVGGDFYDVFPIQENGFAVLIGDVSGKGIPAALLMGVIHGVARTALWQREATNHEEASMRLNRLLCEHASGNRFASLFWCVYDQPLHSLRYVNAGHCPPILIGRRDGKLLTRRLDKGGPVLGLLPHALYEATTVEVASGDLLVMYSDGLTEATNAEGEEYGEDRLAALLHSHADESPAQIREAVLSSFASFASANETQDDLTFAIIRFGTEALHPLSESAPLYDTSSVVS